MLVIVFICVVLVCVFFSFLFSSLRSTSKRFFPSNNPFYYEMNPYLCDGCLYIYYLLLFFVFLFFCL